MDRSGGVEGGGDGAEDGGHGDDETRMNRRT